MNFLKYLLLLVVLASCSSSPRQYDLIITNVNLIDGSGEPMRSGVNVAIEDGIIKEITLKQTNSGEKIIDGANKYLIPGLFDCHVHSTDIDNDFARLIHYGVTSVFVPGGSTASNEAYAQMRELGSQNERPAPRVYHTSQHFTMEGRHPVKTYANSNWVEGETVFFLRDTVQIAEVVKEVAQYPISGIKLTIEDGPAPPFVERMPQDFINKTVAEASKHGLEVFAHVSDNEEFLMAVDGGVRNIVHFTGIELDWEDDELMTAINKMIEGEGSIITTLMIDKSFIYPLHPDWMEVPSFNEAYPEEELKKLLTPAAVATAERMAIMTKEYLDLDELTLENLYLSQIEDIRRLLEMDLNMVLGTDTGNDFNFHGYSLHEEMQILEMGGITPLDIIKMGTLNAAKMLGVDDSLGTIEEGKLADLILLDKNPLESIENTLAINTIFKNGVVQNRITD
ncbi:MAG: amidohydrolase family protein [Cyclobacteriaceae bacterium]